LNQRLIGRVVGLIGLVAATAALAPAAQAAVAPTADPAAAAAAITDQVPTPLVGAGAFTNYGVTDCQNSDDDDDDGVIDLADPDCASAADNFEESAVGDSAPECQDLEDNDGGGVIDLADPDCAGPTDADESTAGSQAPQCTTAGDDDGDGDTGVFPTDPDCVSAADDDEDFVEDCANGDDDDEDGPIDAADGDCAFPYDDTEFPALGFPLAPAAIYDGAPALAGFPVAGARYLVLSSGNAARLDKENQGGDNNGADDGGHGADVFDLVTLKVDLQVPQNADCIGLGYRLITDEALGDEYDDSFVAELDRSDFTTDGNGAVTAPSNFAKDAAGHVIGVNTTTFTGDAAGTGLSDSTPLLRSSVPAAAGPHSVYLSIWDDNDSAVTSSVLIDDLYLGRSSGGQCAVADLVAPETLIGKHPKRKTTKKKVKLGFSANEPATFECKLDKKDFKPCASPLKVKAKKKGKHRFFVQAVDANGNVDATPAKTVWKRRLRKRN
jgi:hypothetical protein